MNIRLAYAIVALVFGLYLVGLSASNLWRGKKYLDFMSIITLLMVRLTSGKAIEKKARTSMLDKDKIKIRSTYYLMLGLVTLMISAFIFTNTR